MSNPRLEELREDVQDALADLHHSQEDAVDALKEFELLLELEFLKKLAAE